MAETSEINPLDNVNELSSITPPELKQAMVTAHQSYKYLIRYAPDDDYSKLLETFYSLVALQGLSLTEYGAKVSRRLVNKAKKIMAAERP